MWDYIINIHQSELLRTKTKEFNINKHNFLLNFKNGQFTFFYLIIFLQDFLKS